jgi:hypothetical protein
MTDQTDTTELHFAYTTSPPAFDDFDVKALTPTTLCGAPATVAVVGQSHVVTAPALDYHEICSCASLAETEQTVALDDGTAGEVRVTRDGVVAETRLRVEPLSAFPGPEGTTISYRFAPEAWTTATVAGDGRGYETYHTYPERDVAVHTETRLTPAEAVDNATATPDTADRVEVER